MRGNPVRRHPVTAQQLSAATRAKNKPKRQTKSSIDNGWMRIRNKRCGGALVRLFMGGVLVCGFCRTIRLFSRRWMSLDNTPAEVHTASSTRVVANEGDVVSPFTSIPPEPIPLVTESSPRHACLANMRQRHETALQSYLAKADHFLLVDPAYHSNVGDHMITLGELRFLQPFLTQGTIQLSQCSYIQAGSFVPPCATEIPRLANLHHHPVAIWHGGGNWGDLWRRAQEPRIASIGLLASHGYTILTMPNSWFYQDQRLEAQDVETIYQSVQAGLEVRGEEKDELQQRLVFCWREEFSFQRGKELLPFATNLLVPDIAFQLGPYNPIRSNKDPMVDILLLLRNDHESVVAQQKSRAEIRSMLNGIPNAQSVSFSIVDWNDRLARFDSKDIFFTSTAIQLLSLGRIVICDRLHAAILAYLMGVPFLYMDQISGKITKTLTASMSECESQSRMERAANLEDALTKALHWLSKLEPNEPLSRAARRERLRIETQRQGT